MGAEGFSDADGVTKRDIAISLDLHLEHDCLTGRARNGGGPAREFSGWVGLVATIDSLLDSHTEGNHMATIDMTTNVGALRARMRGEVLAPGDAAFDAARLAFNAAVDQRPELIAYPVDADDGAVVIRYALERCLRVSPQRNGHNADRLG